MRCIPTRPPHYAPPASIYSAAGPELDLTLAALGPVTTYMVFFRAAKLITAVGGLSSDAGSGSDIMYFACFFALRVLAPNDDDRTSGSVGSSMLQHTVSRHDETRHQKPAQR